MASMEQVLQSITDETTLENSIIALLVSIKADLDAALANQGIPADVQALIDAAFEKIEANKAAVTAAIVANTPQAVG